MHHWNSEFRSNKDADWLHRASGVPSEGHVDRVPPRRPDPVHPEGDRVPLRQPLPRRGRDRPSRRDVDARVARPLRGAAAEDRTPAGCGASLCAYRLRMRLAELQAE